MRTAARLLWNFCERHHIRTPFAPYIFGLMIGRRPHKVKKGKK